MKILKIVLLILVVGLSGCCIDCENTKEEHDNALKRISNLEAIIKNNEAWLNSKEEHYSQLEKYYSKIETQHRENESSVLQARVCDYIVPLCPKDMTEPGRAIIAKYGTKFDTPRISEFQNSKLIIILLGFSIIGVLIRSLWISIVTPTEKHFQEARLLMEISRNEALEIKSKTLADSLKRKSELEIENKKIVDKNALLNHENDLLENEIEESELNLVELTNQSSELKKDIARLKATMDAMKGF